ncbi:DUF1186 domain-containing protein [Mariprofundus ferrooxydans]|nr:DUF1186 domain-containing protein [Mariprofundus ferrooxydans]
MQTVDDGENSQAAQMLFDQMALISTPPDKDAFQAMVELQQEMLPLLLNELSVFADAPETVQAKGDQYIRHIVSIFMLAHLRSKDAYPLLIKLISHPGNGVLSLTGEVLSEALGRILASLCAGRIEAVQGVIENPRLNPWFRSAALDSLMVLCKEGLLGRDDMVAYLRLLMACKLERHASYVWDGIAFIAYEIHPAGLETLLRQAIDDKLIAPLVMDAAALTASLKEPFPDIGGAKPQRVGGLIKSPADELAWWLYPDRKMLQKGADYEGLDVPIVDKEVVPGERIAPMGWRANTVVCYEKKLGRNARCLCGSGKKYKHCCLKR